MASVIPFGQPVHGAADWRYRERIQDKMRRGWDLHKKAERLREHAEAARRNRVIFSDDPNASEKIADRIAKLEQRQTMMRDANKLVRAKDRDGCLTWVSVRRSYEVYAGLAGGWDLT
jgi:hypothetical protein